MINMKCLNHEDLIITRISTEITAREQDINSLSKSEIDNFKAGYCSGAQDILQKIKEILEGGM